MTSEHHTPWTSGPHSPCSFASKILGGKAHLELWQAECCLNQCPPFVMVRVWGQKQEAQLPTVSLRSLRGSLDFQGSLPKPNQELKKGILELASMSQNWGLKKIL